MKRITLFALVAVLSCATLVGMARNTGDQYLAAGDWEIFNAKAPANSAPVVATPLTGVTVNVTPSGTTTFELIEPAGTLAALTLTATSGTFDGQVIYVAFSQSITSLTVSGTNIATTDIPLPTAVTTSATFGFVWSASATKWKRFL